MSDEVKKAYDELLEWGTASVMVVQSSEMPSIYVAAQGGDEDAQMRLSAVGKAVPVILKGGQRCVLCGREADLNGVALLLFVSKQIAPGEDALWGLICTDCNQPDVPALVDRAVGRMGFKRLHHSQAGHA